MGPKGNNFPPLKNEPEDEGLAGDHSKILVPWQGEIVEQARRKSRKVMRKDFLKIVRE